MAGDPFQIDTPPTTPYRAAIAAARPLLSWLLGLGTCRALYERTQSDRDAPFECRALKALDVEPRISDTELDVIPASGPLLVASNHPHGALDGLLLASIVGRKRSDVRVLTNHLLSRIPDLSELCFFVDPFGGPTSSGMVTLHCPPSQLYALGSFLRAHGADTVSVASLDYVLDRDNPLFARLEAFLRP